MLNRVLVPVLLARPSLLNGLQAYWKLSDLTDSSGNGNTLTNNNSVTFAAGKIGNAANFVSASSQYLSRADNATLQAGDIAFTWAAWVYLADKAARRTFVSKRSAVSRENYSIDYSDSADRFRFYLTAGGFYKVASADTFGSPSAATWYFLVGRHDPDADTVGISVNNGAFDTAATGGAAPDTGAFDLNIGRNADAAVLYVNGMIDCVGFWKRLLTVGEITALYNGGAGRTYPFTGA